MEANFPPQYNPEDTEAELYAFWEKSGYFSPSFNKCAENRYVIVFPPPM